MTAQVQEAAFSFDRLFGIEMQNALHATGECDRRLFEDE